MVECGVQRMLSADREAQIRRESRQRTLDEIKAIVNGIDIEHGIGEDVYTAFWSAVGRFLRAEGGC